MPDAERKQGGAQAVPRVDVDGPRERIAKAIEGRNPAGYTEVAPADVLALVELVPSEKNNGVPDELRKGAKRAMRGNHAPEKVAQRTDQLALLLDAAVK